MTAENRTASKITIKKVSIERGSCNSCDRGKIKTEGYGLDYPYAEVYEIDFDRLIVRICDECRKELIEKLGGEF